MNLVIWEQSKHWCWNKAFMLLRYHPCTAKTFPSLFSLRVLSDEALSLGLGVDPLILAWQGGRDTDGTLRVNLICKSKLCLFLIYVFPPHTLTPWSSTKFSQQTQGNVAACLCVCLSFLCLLGSFMGSTLVLAQQIISLSGLNNMVRWESGQTQRWRPHTHRQPHTSRSPLIKYVNRWWTGAWLHLD